MTLEQFFKEIPKAAIAFSGGTDSAFLLWAAGKYGCEVQAYYVNTVFQPAFELEDAAPDHGGTSGSHDGGRDRYSGSA